MNEKIIELFIVLLLSLFFLILIWIFYQLFTISHEYEILKRAWEKSIRVLEEKNRTRKSMEKSTFNLYGEMEKKTWVARLDAMLAYGGIYIRFPKLTAEKFMALFLVLGLAEFLAAIIFTGNLLPSLFVSAITWFFVYEGIRVTRAVRRKKIEDEILHCLDLMEVNALATSDIIQIFGKTAVKVKEPLQTELMSVVIDAEYSGYSSPALRRLANRIENKYMKDLILNLDICSKLKANYVDIIKAGKKIFMQDQINRDRLRKLYKNTFMFVIAMSLIGFFCLYQTGRLLLGSEDIFMVLRNHVGGKVILIYLACITCFSVWRSAIKAFL